LIEIYGQEKKGIEVLADWSESFSKKSNSKE